MSTKRNFLTCIRLLAVLIALATLAHEIAIGRTLGKIGKDGLELWLSELVDPLHARGIDVVAGDAADVPLANRPRVLPLSRATMQRPDYFASGDWMQAFSAGQTGFIAGVQSNASAAALSSDDGFQNIWQNTTQEKRVFISFTRADAKVAEQIKLVLEANGYVAFTYLNPQTGKPKYEAAFAGRMFSEAGRYLLIDTESARKSPGVFFEGALLAYISVSNPKPNPSTPPTGRPPASSAGNVASDATPLNPSGSGSAVKLAEFDRDKFVDGLRSKWIVTENPMLPGTIFVHRTLTGGALRDLIYLIKVENDATWTVYDPKSAALGSFGKRLGTLDRPFGVKVGECNCLL